MAELILALFGKRALNGFKKTEKRFYKCVLDFNFATAKLLKSLYPQSTYFPRDETGLVCLPTQLEHTLQQTADRES
jgi:hypothetical protein